MKKTIYMLVIITTMITISACSNSLKEDNLKLTEEIASITIENENLKNEILQLEEQNEVLNQEIINLKDKLSDYEKVVGDLVPGEGESLFNVYGANIDTYQPEVIATVIIEDDLPLEEKLDIIADELSRTKFGGLGISVSKIEENSGKKVAIVNLSEKTNNNNASWKTGYFQGSTGGTITTTALRDSFLQKEYSGEWIDGVRFLYNNEQINFEHVEGLSQIIYR